MKIEHREFLPKQQASTHASTICFHPNGHPIFAWFEGSREGSPDIFIRLYNLNNDKESILIGNKDGIPRWNPILLHHEKEILLFEKMGVFCDRWQTVIHNITDWDNNISSKEINGRMQILPAGLNGPVKTKPIVYNDYILCGSSVETFVDWTSYVEVYECYTGKFSFYERSNPLAVDKVTYQNPFSGMTAKSLGIIQPALWIDINDCKQECFNALFRSSYGLGKIYHSRSTTWGYPDSWSKPKPIEIDNPNSSVDVVYVNGRLFLACNPVKTGRLPLVVLELDKNLQPVDSIVITSEIEGQTMSQEASYPYMIEKDGKLHLTYTYGRSKIEYVQISI